MNKGDMYIGSINIEIKTIKENTLVCYLLDYNHDRIIVKNHRGELFKTVIIKKDTLKKLTYIKRVPLPFKRR